MMYYFHLKFSPNTLFFKIVNTAKCTVPHIAPFTSTSKIPNANFLGRSSLFDIIEEMLSEFI